MATVFRFGPFELDPQREELKKSGLVLRIPRQPLRLLVLLASRAGETVTREEIQQQIWGSETFVDFEHGINAAIRQIRFHLGDNAEAPRYVRTIPRRGYIFIAAVERVEPARTHFWSRARVAVAAVLLAMTAIAAAMLVPRTRDPNAAGTRHRIAVLPFEVSGAPGIDERAFAAELRAVLAWLPPERVALVDAAAAKNATVVVEGTIEQVPAGARVVVSGVDAASRTQLWSLVTERPADRVHELPADAAYRTLQEIADRFLPLPRHEPRLRTNVSARALDLYRRGRMERSRVAADRDWTRAKSLFEQALTEEPRFAEASSALADLWCERMLIGPGPARASAAAQAVAYAHRALALQPRNAEARNALATVALQHEYDFAAAEEGLRRAVADDPGYADARFNLAIALTTRGAFDEALREIAVARQLDPISYALHPSVAAIYLHARRYEEAATAYRRILAARPQMRGAAWGLMSTYVAQRRWKEATDIAWFVSDTPASKRIDVPATEEGFRSVYRRHGEKLFGPLWMGPVQEYAGAIYYAELGDRENAFSMLHRAVDARAPMVSYLLVDPRFDTLRPDPRFKALVARTRLVR
ncbi:MAG TPA: tetratricopeptide repeat protein [Thermoanaerobaculia bacterium]|nr:tetratricopeptide repeat protein [Thermoanaerobaculia bacterium]